MSGKPLVDVYREAVLGKWAGRYKGKITIERKVSPYIGIEDLGHE